MEKENVNEKARLERLEKENQALLEKLAEQSKEATETKAKFDPKSGAGKLCEAWRITIGEALQVGPNERGQYPPVPKGYVNGSDADKYPLRRRFDRNRMFLIYPDTPDDQFVSNCESRYTKEYEHKYRKTGKTYPDFTYDKKKVFLCEKHAHVLMGVTV